MALLALLHFATTVGAPPASAASENTDVAAREQELALINHARADQGVAPLSENPVLDAAAQSYAEVLTNDACFGHGCSSDPDFIARDTQAGYQPYAILGENVAAGQPTPEEAVAAMMASPEHRENILRPEFTEIGLGIAHGGEQGTYWAQEFGSRG